MNGATAFVAFSRVLQGSSVLPPHDERVNPSMEPSSIQGRLDRRTRLKDESIVRLAFEQPVSGGCG